MFAIILDLTTSNTATRPLSAPVVSSSAISDNSDRSKETSIISTDVTVSLKKNRNGEDKGKFTHYLKKKEVLLLNQLD